MFLHLASPTLDGDSFHQANKKGPILHPLIPLLGATAPPLANAIARASGVGRFKGLSSACTQLA